MQTVLANETVNWVLQAKQLGSDHAVAQAASQFADDEKVLITYGDVPLISQQTVVNLLEAQPGGGVALLTVLLDDPTGYGRIICKNGSVVAIVEQKDAFEEQK